MKIRRLEVQGFKSFADRTVFEFGEGVSAIVGPNGCGKSNVVDAIKWVLGDMSPRSLRGKRMDDVIFAGSRTRKALGMAEVSLILDNEDGLLPTEHTEVAVTRRLHRAGDSEYLINGQTARLRDIRELFLDTGLGHEGNSIMEQGQIDALLAANPHDRRGIFEEAAGVSRYKQRRKEADQRLRRTQDNLERLRDVLELEEKRFRSLRNQASRARRYQALREDLSKKRVLRAVVRYRSIAAERESLQSSMAAVLEKESAAANELASIEERVRTADAEREAARETVHEVEAQIAGAAADARAADDRAKYAAMTIQDLRARVASAREQARVARARIEEIRDEVKRLEEDAARADGEAEQQNARVRGADEELERLDREAASIRDAHEGAKREALNALGRIGDARNEEAEYRAEIRQAQERLQRLAAQHAEQQVQREKIEAEARELYALAASFEAESRERAAALEAAEERRAQRLSAAEAATAKRAEVSEARATKAARLEVLQRLAAANEGVDEGARLVMEELAGEAADGDGSRRGVLGLLADLVRPAPDKAVKLDRLLGHAAGALVVQTADDALSWIQWLRNHGKGARARFLCLDLVRPGAEERVAEVAPLGCDFLIERLVGSVIDGTELVPDLSAGIRAFRERGVNAVTEAGERVTTSGAVLGGQDAHSMGLVERTAEIRALRADLERLSGEADQARAEAQAADEAVKQSDEEIRRLRTELADRAEDKSRRGEALARVEKERAHVEQSLEVLGAETAELNGLLGDSRRSAEEVAARVAALETERESLEEKAEEAARGYLAIDAARKRASEHRMDVRLAQAEARSRAEAARRRVERAHEEARGLEERAAGLDREAEELSQRMSKAEVEVTEAQATMRQREAEREQAGNALVAARKVLDDLESSTSDVHRRQREVADLHDQLRSELEAFRLRDSEFRVRIESLLDQVRQDHDLDLAAVSQETEATEDIDLGAMDAEVDTLRTKLAGLGNVNLNAIAELEEVEEHVTFLQNQEKDLLQAKSDLERAIHELDQLSTERFGEVFEVIRENFRETFRRLFGGGRAEIVLEDASNVLESGIEIVARPPGKEQRTISLLSGGERTLTAVALLFAVFKTKPSPFSVLDEVDAALDEANVRRLVSLVGEFTDRCQFLIVTHAKATMETADVLYGVTMEEPGVSKRVAVRLTEYQEAVAAG